MKAIFGILNHNGTHTDVSNTLRGAKCYASRNGYEYVTKRNEYNATVVSKKEGKKWLNF